MSNSSPNNGSDSPEPTALRKGRLKVFLGYAAGVGKTYQMLEEAQELTQQGVDVVVGYFEPHGRVDTIAKLDGLEVIPRKVMEYRNVKFEEMDIDAITARHPEVCVVDEFPHTNITGSKRNKRWEDVVHLLESGIDVLTTMNVQHLESLNDQIYRISGVRVRETVPDWVVQQASEVVMVDLTPRALLNRLERGVVYQPDKAQRAKENFFKESTLVALRELALRETAFEVKSRHTAVLETRTAAPGSDTQVSDALPKVPERVLVHITADPSTAALIRRGKRVADYLQTQCLAVALCPGKDLSKLPPDEREALEIHLSFARNLHIQTHLLAGNDVADELVTFARQNGVTQIYLSRPKSARWGLPFAGDLVQRVARLARDIEVTIVAERSPRPATVN